MSATRPIDPSLFVAESDPRAFVRQVSIAAPIETVFAVWSDGEFFAQTYDPGSTKLKARDRRWPCVAVL